MAEEVGWEPQNGNVGGGQLRCEDKDGYWVQAGHWVRSRYMMERWMDTSMDGQMHVSIEGREGGRKEDWQDPHMHGWTDKKTVSICTSVTKFENQVGFMLERWRRTLRSNPIKIVLDLKPHFQNSSPLYVYEIWKFHVGKVPEQWVRTRKTGVEAGRTGWRHVIQQRYPGSWAKAVMRMSSTGFFQVMMTSHPVTTLARVQGWLDHF